MKALGLAAMAAALVAGCGSQSTSAPVPPRSPSPEGSASSANAAAPALLSCEKPAPEAVRRVNDAVGGPTGPVLASVAVLAAKTVTGQWYVVGVDRSSVYDNGQPSGSGTRQLVLTNSVAGDSGATMIALASGSMRRPAQVSWDDVSWTGDTLAAGRKATAKAIQCLRVANPELRDS